MSNLSSIGNNTNSLSLYPSSYTVPLMENMVTSGSITKIASALVKAQQKMGNALKDSKNPFFKSSYADLNSIREAVMPALSELGVGVFQPTVVVNGKQFVRTLLLHESGEFLSADTEVVAIKQNDPQAHGSAVSYARRYGLQSFLNCGTTDDDGEAAMVRKSAPVEAPSKSDATPTEAPKKTSSFRKAATTPAPAPEASKGPLTPPATEGWE